jgi:hypothetical protein
VRHQKLTSGLSSFAQEERSARSQSEQQPSINQEDGYESIVSIQLWEA